MGRLGVPSFLKQIKNCVVILVVIFIIISIIPVESSSIESLEDDEIGKLAFCGDENDRTINRRLIYVTTLDGTLTALDLSKQGNVHWSIETGPGPLISSSIHRLELTNNGKWVRMIPSLSGGIYKFDGESIDPIPINADNLLSSSFKFSDELVISGGKETRSYGVSARTGQVLYECSMHGCMNDTESMSSNSNVHDSGINEYLDDHDPLLDDVVIVRRQTQTVRAIEPRSGVERWNFSVGHHELEVLKSPDCHSKPFNDFDLSLLDLEIKVVVPEGIICAFDKRSPNVILWKHQFDHPIVSAWQTDNQDNLKAIDLFNSAQWLWNGEREEITEQEGLVAPSLYVGMFKKQLYIQESKKLEKLVSEQANNFNQYLLTSESNFPRIPWKPFPATSAGTALIAADTNNKNIISSDMDENNSVTALSVLYASEYVNGNGFYLYSSTDLNKTHSALCDSNNKTTNESDEFDFQFIDDDTPAKIIIVSLWFWWKEILVISLTSALVLNLLLAPKIRGEREVLVIERHVPVPTAMEAVEDASLSRSRSGGSQRSFSESNSNNSENFTSRFLNDFDLVQCLGKGGFGVVFEAKNKIDDCNYAIKRIILPNKKESRERVMREVKTLASCEHQNIVRYFQAWVENPPPGWQEAEDMKWMEMNNLSTSIEIETPDGTTLPPFPKDSSYTYSLNILNKNNHINSRRSSWILNFKKRDNIDENSFSKNSIHNIKYTDDDDSFIQFKDEDEEDNDSDSVILENDESKRTSNGKITFADRQVTESFGIEFKHSTNGYSNRRSVTDEFSMKKEISSSYTQSFSKSIHSRFRHKRPMSLDLSSQGNVILPITPPKCQNKVYLYIQMQLCRKQSLKDWLLEHKLEKRLPNVCCIFEQIVDAVEYVHLKGLIHRDLKPSNIFFSLDGQIKIGDFGLVTDMADNPNLMNGTNSGRHSAMQSVFRDRHTQQVGTHLYMSPEQVQGLPYDFKVDIYSLGLIFFELLIDFGTEMERIETLQGLRAGKFPSDFQEMFNFEHNLLISMLSSKPETRPDTTQIKQLIVEKPFKEVRNG